jgi:hypothetical protein
MTWSGLFKGSMEKRAAQPNPKAKGANSYDLQFGAAADVKIPLAVHHVVDWALLRDVWNRMVEDKHYATICAWLYAVGFDVNNVFYETQKAQTPALIVQTMMRGADIGEVADPDEIHQRVTWSTWNLVQGPKESTRTDDRGNFNDSFADVAGVAEEERAYLRCTDTVDTVMRGFNLSAAVDGGRASQLTKALLAVNRSAKVIKYRPEMWVGSAGKWRKNTR